MIGQPHRDTAALVIGGGQGLGLAIAQRLVAEGCRKLVIGGRDRTKGDRAVAALAEAGAEAAFVAVDMADAQAAIALVNAAAERMGRIDALINSAADCSRGSVLDTTPEDWDRLMNINAKGPFFALQRTAQLAVAAERPASVVNILSVNVHCGQSFLAGYSASKAALGNVTRNAANALRWKRIRVNGIACGWMNTAGEDATQRKWHGAGDDWLEKASAAQPFGQLVEPEEVAGLATYMAGPESGVMTGSIVDYDQTVIGAYQE